MAELIFPDGFEEKTTIAQDDYILMADSEDNNKIKKAKYSNLKGEKGDPGQDGQDGQDGADGQDGQDGQDGTDGASIISGEFSGNDLVFGKNDGTSVTIENAKTTLQGPEGEEGPEGPTGPAGNGITSVTATKSGKTTTVTMNYTSGDPTVFQVQDGADGQGSGDVIGPNSSTDGNVVLFDGITGKLIKDSGTALGTAASKNTGTSAGNVPVLDSNGKLNTSTLPGVALTDTFTVSTASDLTNLSSAEQGDIAIATSENKTYVLASEPYSTAANWKEILAPTGGVTSVNGQTGAVTVQETLVSGTNIKTIDGASILSSGNISTGMVVLSYGSSTWNDFKTAYLNNKIVYCKASSNANPGTGTQSRLAFMVYVTNPGENPTSVEFQYYRSVSSHSSSQQGDQVFVYTLASDGTWSVTTREASSNIVAGTGLSSSYSSGTLTINSQGITNDTTGTTTSVTKIRAGTEAEYALITPNANTIYYTF